MKNALIERASNAPSQAKARRGFLLAGAAAFGGAAGAALGYREHDRVFRWSHGDPVVNPIQKCVTLKGVRGHSYSSVELALELIASGKYPLGEMCTHQYSLHEVDDALRTTGGAGAPGAIHVTVLPWR